MRPSTSSRLLSCLILLCARVLVVFPVASAFVPPKPKDSPDHPTRLPTPTSRHLPSAIHKMSTQRHGSINPFSTLEDAIPQSIINFWLNILQSYKKNLLLVSSPLVALVQYQPPVGIVTCWVTYHWLHRFLFPNRLDSLDLTSLLPLRRKKQPRSSELDAADRDYTTLGGVQTQALQKQQQQHEDDEFTNQWIEKSSCEPQASRSQCARHSVETMIDFLQQQKSQSDNDELAILLEVRALDALLRCIRDDDLLPLVDRLRSQQEACERNSYQYSTVKQRILRSVQTLTRIKEPLSLEDARAQYQLASHQLQDQYAQLGELQELLLHQPQFQQQKEDHLTQCRAWNGKAKALLKELVMRIMYPKDDDKASMSNVAMLKEWSESTWTSKQWKKALIFLEAKYAPAKYTSLLESVTAGWNYKGIPSALVKIALAKAVHNSVMPYWPMIKTTGHQIGLAIWGIVEFRFYKPLKVILMDLLNKRPRLLDPSQLFNEQTSLQNMLRDLGISVDELDKATSMAQASRMYENQLKNGAVKNMIFGQMVRLLLIQVQQLKAELLQAFQSIDELVDANRLNVSLLATIPAFLLVRWGSRVMYSLLYRLRIRDVRGLHDAHMELTSRLRNLERLLILGDGDLPKDKLGEFISEEHKYLLLLDYCQPPFPAKQVDSICKDMQDLLPIGGLDRETQLDLLKLIHKKNDDLLKSL